MRKRLAAAVLSLVLVFAFAVPALAQTYAKIEMTGGSFSNVGSGTVTLPSLSTNCALNAQGQVTTITHVNFALWMPINAASGDWIESGYKSGANSPDGTLASSFCYSGYYYGRSLGGVFTNWTTSTSDAGGTQVASAFRLALINDGSCGANYSLYYYIKGAIQAHNCSASSLATIHYDIGMEFAQDSSGTFTATGASASGMDAYDPAAGTWLNWNQKSTNPRNTQAGYTASMNVSNNAMTVTH